MVLDVSKIKGIGDFTIKKEPERELYFKGQLAFLVLRRNTIEVRCDSRLSESLKSKYESVMDSRYYGRGGIEIVLAGQLSPQEIEDLIRLSYQLTQ